MNLPARERSARHRKHRTINTAEHPRSAPQIAQEIGAGITSPEEKTGSTGTQPVPESTPLDTTPPARKSSEERFHYASTREAAKEYAARAYRRGRRTGTSCTRLNYRRV